MRTIVKIYGVEKRQSKAGAQYFITHCLTDVGDECEYYGNDLKLNDSVEVFFHYNKVKCRKGLDKANGTE